MKNSNYVVSMAQMYALDEYTIKTFGISARVLMENAGKRCAESIHTLHNIGTSVCVVAGGGNNGGDGFVVARWLFELGHTVSVISMGKTAKMSAQTLANYQLCKKLSFPVYDFDNELDIEAIIKDSELLVDAIFGIGASGTPRGIYAQVIKIMNASSAKVYALDIPSGLNADTGQADIAVIADVTYALANVKQGMLMTNAIAYVGDVEIISIGIPAIAYQTMPNLASLINAKNVTLPRRYSHSHKGSYGCLAIIAGSRQYSGAAILCARAALRSGAGIVHLFCPADIMAVYHQVLPAVIKHKLGASTLAELESCDALLIGPGLGQAAQVKLCLQEIISNWEKPLVIDADAINIIAKANLLKTIKSKNVLITPHLAEFSRLTGTDIHVLNEDIIKHLKSFCEEYAGAVLLKNATTIYCDIAEIVFDISGNDGLSTGGSGDILAGIIIAFIGQGLSIKQAATGASWLLGNTAEVLVKYRKTASIIPTDILDYLFVNEI